MPKSSSATRRLPSVLLPFLVLGVLSAGCAAPYAVRAPSPDEIPELEARSERAPRDVEALTLLGAAYREAGRLEDAGQTLQRAVDIDPRYADAVFFLGLTYEDMERFGEARELYGRHLEISPSGPLAERLEDRMALLRRKEIRLAVRQALEREREIADTPADPTTIAVFPFPFEGESEELRPLGMALSGMVATDLAQSGRLTVLERARLHALLDEIALGRTGLVDRQTAARGGRILGAGRIVQGRVSGSEDALALDAAVVEVGRTDAEAGTVEARDVLDRLFDLQKELVLGIFDAMGVTLTAAEREQVTQRRTENLAALLAYGRGIEASYGGDPAEAARHFSEAARLDPGFDEAVVAADESESVAAAESSTTSELVQQAVDEAVATTELEREAVEAVERAADWNPQRDSPVVGEGGIASTTGLRVIIRRPSGGGQ